MRIAILGTGNVGRRLAAGWLRRGHQITFGSRTPETVAETWPSDVEPRPRFTSVADAVTDADAVVLAVPWPNVPETLDQIGPLAGRIVIDCTNPLKPDLSGLAVGQDSSAAEMIAARLPEAHVVKAFNTVGAGLLDNPRFGPTDAPLFFCGDEAVAKLRVRDLIADLGFEPIDAGPLRVARYLEPFAMLFIHLAVFEGWRDPFAVGILRRLEPPQPDRPDGGPGH